MYSKILAPLDGSKTAVNQLEEDYRAQRITPREYEIREGQVEIGFALY